MVKDLALHPVRLSVNSSRHVPKHTKQHKQTPDLAPSHRVCRSSRPASPRVCGWFVVVFSRCVIAISKYFQLAHGFSQIRQTVSQNCAKPSLRFQSAAKQRIDIRFCHEVSRAQHNRTNENDETLTLASKEYVGSVCWVEKPSHDKQKSHHLVRMRTHTSTIRGPASIGNCACVNTAMSTTAPAAAVVADAAFVSRRWPSHEVSVRNGARRSKRKCKYARSASCVILGLGSLS